MRVEDRTWAGSALWRPVAALLVVGAVGLTSASAGARPQAPSSASHPVKAAKLDSALARVAAVARARGARAGTARARLLGLRTTATAVQVQVEARDPAAATAAVRAAGGSVPARYHDLLDARVPARSLTRVAASRAVRAVEQPTRPRAASVVDEAVATTGASGWLSDGTAGNGVTVAIVDTGFAGWQARQASGDLPADVITADFCAPGEFDGSDAEGHGTAVAEVVHDMAPGARLALVCVDTLASLGQAKDWVVGKGIPIVNHSDGWFNTGRGDGTGAATSPDGIVADARAHGVLWVNAAGNEAQNHWSGTFVDSDGNGWLDYAPATASAPIDEGNSFTLARGQQVCAFLKWDDWPASAQDYDLYLYRESPAATPGQPAEKPKLMAWSTNLQSGTQPPTEVLCYTNDTSAALTGYDLAIRADSVTQTPRLDLFTTFSPGPQQTLQYNVQSGSLVDPAGSPHALTVGAACWFDSSLEPFSSQGPTIDGRAKPDLTAPDGVSTVTDGTFASCTDTSVGFFGTSAAAAHVAGAAALLKQAHPAWGPSELQAALEGAALDVGAAGKDDVFGSGLLTLGAPPPVPPPPPTPGGPPVITGTPQQGGTLTAGTGSWSGPPPVLFAYQWQRCTAAGSGCVDVAGALAATYTPAPADVASTLRVVVTAFNTGGSASTTSAPTAPVLPPAPVNTVQPSLGGTAAPGYTLTTSLGIWTGTGPLTYAVDWRRCDVAGSGCTSTGVTGPAYQVKTADTGTRLRAYVTASNGGGSATATSGASLVVPPAPPENQAPPEVTGAAKVGSILSATTGTWADASTYAFRWWRCVGTTCAYIRGATAATITLGPGDVGATFRAVVTASNAGGSTSAHSAPTDAVAGQAVAELRLLAGSAATSRRPVGGGIFTARVAVARTDGRSVAGARVQCGAFVGGRALHVRTHSFAKRIATCTWKLPRWTGGRQISGSIRVAAGGLTVSRAFSARIGRS